LPAFNERRIANAAYYNRRLSSDRLMTPVTRPGARHVFHQYTVRLPGSRDQVMNLLATHGIESRVYYPLPLHRQPLYLERGFRSDALPEADRAAAEVLSLPVHPGLSEDQVQHVAETVSDIIENLERQQ
jgi:dTDP-4-amino-4,6-dideoxygalactose transaminase